MEDLLVVRAENAAGPSARIGSALEFLSGTQFKRNRRIEAYAFASCSVRMIGF